MDFKEIIKICYSISDFCKMLGFHQNGLGMKKAKQIINEHNLDISHFDKGLRKKLKYEKIVKVCPVCNSNFETQKRGDRREKKTCSVSCSNTKFRSGSNNGNWKSIDEYNSRTSTFAIKYRKICFEFHEHKCVVSKDQRKLKI